MTNLTPSLLLALLWAGLIIGAAFLSAWLGLSDAASVGITAALSGGAVVTMPGLRRSRCTASCGGARA
jgi:hypothetical protein